ncbi:prolyl oligopeptidase family serine peptidase [Parapedobacter sp. 2B3]|uniref:S9 family peptidase n=1 Tax=Parapedobacter sp. 2B3 TaxID=3342381 RepID=UPI0035B62E18
MYKRLLFVAFIGFQLCYAQQSALTVEYIMRDPKWIGTSPVGAFWGADGALYFDWNPQAEEETSLYRVAPGTPTPQRVNEVAKQALVRQYAYAPSRKRAVFERGGDLYLRDLKSGDELRLTNTIQHETNPYFNGDGTQVFFQQGDNLFSMSVSGGEWTQLSNFVREERSIRRDSDKPQTEQNKWLEHDQLQLFDVLQARHRQDSLRNVRLPDHGPEGQPRSIHIGNAMLSMQQASPDGRYVSYVLIKRAENNTNTIVPSYVTESGYTEDIPARTKVGNASSTLEAYLYDRHLDTTYRINTTIIPGIRDLPAFWDDYPDTKSKLLADPQDRQVSMGRIIWNEAGTDAVVAVAAADHKDRWIMRLDAATGALHLIDRQRDEAWIGGPGIGGAWGGGSLGWIDNETIYFQSEASGYSHLYRANARTGERQQLTNGRWEVSDLQLSADHKQFYFTANIVHPGITHFYRLPASGGTPIRITGMDGGNEVVLSPDEKWLAIRYSYSNKPWELYLQENKAGTKAIQVTESVTNEFKAYAWREPEVITFNNRHGDEIYARLYQPINPKPHRPAVIFVHGAGYLQNVHYWWSQYFREYLFHNLLADLGYTVLDIDYTGSSGYGRDHRTGIYRHMGGKDLSDQVDGARLLVEKYNVNAKNIGIYGGSYGGFITLMAMFNEPEVFAAGAALRSVTDWAHYNHGYTSNILNEPVEDPIAYRRSSPIYFAEGLSGHLLLCHGMVDVNVHFQDIVRLSQRLIELGKNNWELAVYPVEDHGFVEPSSWTDEYKRILKLFEERLNN